MLYTKPKDMKFVDLCIFFDNNFWKYDDTYDEVKCYQYLYCVMYILARKKRYFKLTNDLESFALFATTTIYMRFLKKKNKHIPPIKSVLNYVNPILHHLKGMWQQQEYSQSVLYHKNVDLDSEVIKELLREKVKTQYNHNIRDAVIEGFREIRTVIKDLISTLPYKKDVVLSRNLEISCLLSLENDILVNSGLLLKNKLKQIETSDIYSNLILFRLDNSMKDILLVTVNKIKKKMSEILLEIIGDNTLDIDTLDSILATGFEAVGMYKVDNTQSLGDNDKYE